MVIGVATGWTAPPGRLALGLLLLAAAGCASLPRGGAGERAGAGGWRLVEDVPEVRQSSRDACGAAALAMVLARWDEPVSQDEILAATVSTPGQGIRADALRDFARSRGLQAFLVQGDAADLEREVARDRPVVVGVVKRRGRRAYPHYEVVVGYDRERQRILTLDPARGRREERMDRFDREWAATGRLTLVVFPPASAPASTGRGAP